MPFLRRPVTIRRMTRQSRLHTLGALIGAVVIVSVGLTHVLSPPAYAAVPAVTVPGRVYPTPTTVMNFAGIDPVSGDDRGLHVSGLQSNQATCQQVN